ncbi:hypothetical protein [Laspinema palackyanum]|uniref:hypothetical protein n=1 Tax=Laspinema palackyanum TaxID=3231601 RepID=UPI00345DE166|nr:hypothetical protein [Laspinema sp. D2c]
MLSLLVDEICPHLGVFLCDRRFTVVSALIMRVTRSQVLGGTGIIGAIASGSPRFLGIYRAAVFNEGGQLPYNERE